VYYSSILSHPPKNGKERLSSPWLEARGIQPLERDEDWYRLISYYVDRLHLRTVEQIIPIYAPSSENDVAAYITAVEHAVDAWHSQRSA
jgi:hypothetical protein